MSEQLFRLEYNKNQSQFHHERQNSGTKENTHGWITVFDHASNDEIMLFDIFLEYSTGKKEGWSNSEVMRVAERHKAYLNELVRLKFIIKKA